MTTSFKRREIPMNPRNWSRREFMKTVGAGTAALGVPVVDGDKKYVRIPYRPE